MTETTDEFQVEVDETLINRVRGARALDMTFEEAIQYFESKGIAPEAVFLAWHAAGVLDT